jgi:hypothetical protein
MALPSITFIVAKRDESEQLDLGETVVLTLQPEPEANQGMKVLTDLELEVTPELKQQMPVGQLVRADLSLVAEEEL